MISVKIKVVFKKGMHDRIRLLGKLIIKAIMLGKKEIKVRGVKALWASLKVLARLAIAIHKPLINNE